MPVEIVISPPEAPPLRYRDISRIISASYKNQE
jgi:hypothetical protein